ncbi:protein PIMREG isoform X2 [Macrotis lagotis]|uniref:protein PIMREG isoform X2 n=1 Tax=Macrotis lagotis TaxID=92651 RepID=UPI003D69E96B
MASGGPGPGGPEEESPPGGRQRPPGPLRALRARLPLRVLHANFREGPPWAPLESSGGAPGTVAQKVQESCQGSGRSRGVGCAPGGSSAGLRGAPSSRGPRLRRISGWIAKDPLLALRRRSQRGAALRSPYGSPAPLCPPRDGCSEEEEDEMESVTTGIQQLKRLSQAFDEAITTDESDLTVSLIQN